ncbi:hypothetical protein B0T10DRAFT_77328 [Thelonectria olida]|uniref:Uncharacterized protein n=1 Tax=Thelonectria olida TaxID=1576542 RepID=A0A9P8W0Q5_9HYPO|nr:hypothetical protein B0T10DRAFT_77328 [Thelonectria olida]
MFRPAAPNLTHLEQCFAEASPSPDLDASALSAFSSLETLSISPNIFCRCQSDPQKPPCLAEITPPTVKRSVLRLGSRLCVCADGVLGLAGKVADGRFPLLRRLEFELKNFPTGPETPYTSYRYVAEALEQYREAFGGTPVSLYFYGSFFNWLSQWKGDEGGWTNVYVKI